jgi:hypothetical protein
VRDPIAHGSGTHHTHYFDFVHKENWKQKKSFIVPVPARR